MTLNNRQNYSMVIEIRTVVPYWGMNRRGDKGIFCDDRYANAISLGKQLPKAATAQFQTVSPYLQGHSHTCPIKKEE